MKRVLCVLLLAMAAPVLLIPAMAAEEYIFERVPSDIMLFGTDYDFLKQDGVFLYSGQIPVGSYDVSLLGSDSAFIAEPFAVSYSEMVNVSGGLVLPGCTIKCTLSFGNIVFPATVLFVYYEEIESTAFAIVSDAEGVDFDFSAFSGARLTSLPGTAPVPSLIEFVSIDVVDGVLNEIISVLPVVVIAFVAFVAFRKGFAWLSDLLRGT